MNLLGIEDIINAKQRIEKYVSHTPILTSSLLNRWLRHDFFFKAECFQKIGAFKARGACNTVAWLVKNNKKPKHIIANTNLISKLPIYFISLLYG